MYAYATRLPSRGRQGDETIIILFPGIIGISVVLTRMMGDHGEG